MTGKWIFASRMFSAEEAALLNTTTNASTTAFTPDSSPVTRMPAILRSTSSILRLLKSFARLCKSEKAFCSTTPCFCTAFNSSSMSPCLTSTSGEVEPISVSPPTWDWKCDDSN